MAGPSPFTGTTPPSKFPLKCQREPQHEFPKLPTFSVVCITPPEFGTVSLHTRTCSTSLMTLKLCYTGCSRATEQKEEIHRVGSSQSHKVHPISTHHKGREGPPKIYLRVNISFHQESQHTATLKQNHLRVNLSSVSIGKRRRKSKALRLEDSRSPFAAPPN